MKFLRDSGVFKREENTKRSKFGAQLRQARESMGYRLIDVEKKIGVSQATLSRYETGDQMPGVDRFAELCDLYCESPNGILDWWGAPT